MKKWTALVLEYVEYEFHNLPEALTQQQPEIYNIENATIQASGVQSMRIQNLAITLDKVVHLLKVMKTNEPPIRPLSASEIFKKLWINEKSIRSQLFKVLEVLDHEIDSNNPDRSILKQIRGELKDNLKPEDTVEEYIYDEINEKIRDKFLRISNLIGFLNSTNVHVQSLSDILFMYSFTKSYFTPCISYEKVISAKVDVRLCDVNEENIQEKELKAEDQEQTFYHGTKEYDSSFIWGQLAGWFKQTVDKPNASLSAERRGALSYPDIGSFIIKAGTQISKTTSRQQLKSTTTKDKSNVNEEPNETEEEGKKKRKGKKVGEYPIGEREDFYKKLIQNPSFMWPPGNSWKYKNKERIYGTLQFESLKVADMNKRSSKWDYLKNVIEKLLQQNHGMPN